MKKIVMCGTHEAGWEIIKYLLENGIQISYFVLLKENLAKAEKISGYVDFEPLAKEYNIPIYYVDKYSLKSEKDIQFFLENEFDLLIQGGWQRLFPNEVLNTLKIGAIGVHGSSDLLPKGRGRSPINWSLIEGKKRFIMQFFLIKPGIDDGDIFHFEDFDINEWDNCRTLYYKNSIVTKRALLEFLPKLLNGEVNFYQQKGEPTYYPKRTEEDGRIDWKKTVFEIYNFIRAITEPYPGAFCFCKGQKIKIWKATPFDTRIVYSNALEGEVVEKFKNGDFVVNVNSGLLLVDSYEGNVALGDILE